MKKTNKLKTVAAKLVSGCLAAIIVLSAMPIAMAASCPPVIPGSVASASNGEASPAASDRVWYYRNYNGKLQKRCWSMTWAKWLTDWIDCE